MRDPPSAVDEPARGAARRYAVVAPDRLESTISHITGGGRQDASPRARTGLTMSGPSGPRDRRLGARFIARGKRAFVGAKNGLGDRRSSLPRGIEPFPEQPGPTPHRIEDRDLPKDEERSDDTGAVFTIEAADIHHRVTAPTHVQSSPPTILTAIRVGFSHAGGVAMTTRSVPRQAA